MRYSRELLTVGLATATLAGCGGNSPNNQLPNAQPTPAVPVAREYDISNMECDVSEAMMEAATAGNTHSDLRIKALRPKKHSEEIVTSANGRGPEIINPPIITCNGTIKYVLGIDRGFGGTDKASYIPVLATDVTFSKVNPAEGWKPKRIPFKQLGRYIIKTTVRDNGPSKYGGVSGLASIKEPIIGYGLMP